MDEHYIINSQNDSEQIYVNTNSDIYVNNKYVSSNKDNINNNNFIGTLENNYSEIKEEEFEESPIKNKNKSGNSNKTNNDHLNEIENLPLKLDLDKEKGNINNMIINDSPYDSTIENYIKMENLYLQDGKVNTSITNIYSSNNTVKNSTPNFFDTKRNSEILQKNEEKLKNLQNELERKIGNNFDIQNFEIDENGDNTDNIDSELNLSLNNENEYNDVSEIRQIIRNEKELKMKKELIKELRPKLYNEIYNKEYYNIYVIIKNEVEKELKEQLNIFSNEEISEFKKKQNLLLMNKEKEIGNNIREQCENEMEIELYREIDLKEKEYKLKYNHKLELFKKKIETDLNKKYEKKKQELKKEINAIKCELFRTKCNGKLKINKINTLKNNIKIYNDRNNKVVETLDKLINSRDLEDETLIHSNSQKSRTLKINDKNTILKSKSFISKKNNLLSKKNNNNQLDNLLYTLERSDSTKYLLRNASNNSVNLRELNYQLRLNTGRSCKNMINRRYLSNDKNNNENDIKNNKFIEQDSYSPLNLKTNLINYSNNNIFNFTRTINTSRERDHIYKRDSFNNFFRKKSFDKNYLNKQNNNLKNIFYSIQIDKNIPISISEFGNYLIKHIEKEEKYKIVYNNEIKSFQYKIKQIFENVKGNDHCLTDYMINLWDKLQTSYFTRYQIMKQIIKLHPSNLYSFLDRETEYLNHYFKISEKIFSIIEQREKLKLKLQILSDRNELSLDDQNKFYEITHVLENLIIEFKQKYKNIDIIWKGLKYESFMNYENWFYEMENFN